MGSTLDTEIVRNPDPSVTRKVFFEAFFPADQSFDVKLKVDRNNEMVKVYEGFSNEIVTGKWVKFNGNDGTVDPVLTDDYDETVYTYEDDQGGDTNSQ